MYLFVFNLKKCIDGYTKKKNHLIKPKSQSRNTSLKQPGITIELNLIILVYYKFNHCIVKQ